MQIHERVFVSSLKRIHTEDGIKLGCVSLRLPPLAELAIDVSIVAWLRRKEKVTPWDVGELQLPLKHLIESREVDFPRRGRALVPGCGKGTYTILAASFPALSIVDWQCRIRRDIYR